MKEFLFSGEFLFSISLLPLRKGRYRIFKHLLFPVRDLRRMNLEILSNLSSSPDVFNGFDGDPSLELRVMSRDPTLGREVLRDKLHL